MQCPKYALKGSPMLLSLLTAQPGIYKGLKWRSERTLSTLTTAHKRINQSGLCCAEDPNRWSQWYPHDLKMSRFMAFFLSLNESLKHFGPVFHRTVQVVPIESLRLLPGKAWPLILSLFLLWKSVEGELNSSIINGFLWLVLTALESCPQSDGLFI